MTPAGRFGARLDPANAGTTCAIAAGSGITPVLSILDAALEAEPDSQFTLVYGNRTPASVMFLEELADLKDRYPAGSSWSTCCPASSRRPSCSAAGSTPRARPAARDDRCRRSTSTSGSCAGRSRWSSRPATCCRARASRAGGSTPSFPRRGRAVRVRRASPATSGDADGARGDGQPRRPDHDVPVPPDGSRAGRRPAVRSRRALRLQGRGLRHLPGQARRRAGDDGPQLRARPRGGRRGFRAGLPVRAGHGEVVLDFDA